jgi:hypothetical protein
MRWPRCATAKPVPKSCGEARYLGAPLMNVKPAPARVPAERSVNFGREIDMFPRLGVEE